MRKRYGARWRKVREMYVKISPLCEMCEAEGRVVPVEEVHHKIPLDKGGTDDFGNLMSLCKSCHSRITVNEWV
jgi:5-methylcytosine-specific restriction protein A